MYTKINRKFKNSYFRPMENSHADCLHWEPVLVTKSRLENVNLSSKWRKIIVEYRTER